MLLQNTNLIQKLGIFAPMEAQYKKLVQNFRLSIRRRQIDTLFQSQRQRYRKNEAYLQNQSLLSRLQDKQTRQNWLQDAALKLSGVPDVSWTSILNNLYAVVPLFENDHQRWITLGIVKSVCDLMSQQHYHLNLMKISANILTDVLYIASKNQCQRVIKSMLQLKYIDRTINLLKQNQAPQYCRLIGNTCEAAPTLRNYMINLGLLDYIIKTFDSFNQQSCFHTQFIRSLFNLIFGLLKIYDFDPTSSSKPRKSTVLVLLSIISKQIQKPHSVPNLSYMLKSLRQLCRLEKPEIFQQLLKHENIFNKAIDMVSFEQRPEIRLEAVKFLSQFLLSQNVEHTRYLSNKQILDKIYASYMLTSNRDENKLLILKFLSNFTADHIEFQNMVIAHPIFTDILLDSVYSGNQKISQQSVYSICNILRKLEDTQPVFCWLQNMKITQALIHCLSRHDRNPETIVEILDTWRHMLIQSNTGCSNRLYLALKNYHGVESILQDIVQADDQLEDQIVQFISFLSQFQCN